MPDYYGVGFSQLLSSLALLGGFFGAGTFFGLNQLLKKEPSNAEAIVWVIVSVLCFGIFIAILIYLNTSGTILVQYSKTLPADSQILINMSCSDKMNCSAIIPNNLQISCPEQNCPPQTVCPTQIPISLPQTSKVNKYQWCLALPY